MSAIDVEPLVMKDVVMTIGADSYQAALVQVTFTPSASVMTFVGLAANTRTDVSTATWTTALGYAQDWDTPTSLSRYLHANEGAVVSALFQPRSGTGPSFTAVLTITPGAIGGNVNAYAMASVTLGSTRPELVEDETSSE